MNDRVLPFAIGGHNADLIGAKASHAKVDWSPRNGAGNELLKNPFAFLRRENGNKILTERALRRFLHGLFFFGQLLALGVGEHALQPFKGFPAMVPAEARNHVL